LHWQDNPVKSFTAGVEKGGGIETIYPWYEKKRQEEDPVTLAQEIDIDYGAAADNIVIPSEWVRAAVEMDLPAGSQRQAGLDPSGAGSDETILCVRAGAALLSVERIFGGEQEQPDRVEEKCRQASVGRLVYDRMGVGSGITATLKKKESDLPFRVVGVANSDKNTNTKFDDKPDVPAHERFKDFAAEMWWALRLRFANTFKRANGQDIDPTECISVPGESELITQLSQPQWTKTQSDKIKIDKFGEGASSPDYAEACLYSFAIPPTADWSSLEAVDAMVA
jgi:hypothetical protein